MQQYPKIILRKGKEESLKRFHPWVFSGAIQRADEGIEEGDTVAVLTSGGELVGYGHYQIGSIAVRMLTFSDTPIDAALYSQRLRQALAMRQALGIAGTAYRLVHGEGDFLPGLVIDIYGTTAVVQAHSPAMHLARHIIADALCDIEELHVDNVYYKSETTLPFKAQLDPQNEYLRGQFVTDIAEENGLRFHIDWLRGQKTGFFIDQRDNRRLLQQYSQGKRVLNMFCYTGGFSCYAMRGGALKVDSVDSSAKAIQLTDENIALNFDEADRLRHRAIAVDAFKYLAEMQQGDYDLIVLDPPAFAKHKNALRNALIGYRKLNTKAIEKIAHGGILFTFSCSQAVSREQFRLAVFSAAAAARRKVRILHQLTQPADHPINIYHPEGEYLKGIVLYIE